MSSNEVSSEQFPIPLLSWLRQSQQAGLAIIAVASKQLPDIGSIAFTRVPNKLDPLRLEQLSRLLSDDESSSLLTIYQEHIDSVHTNNPIKLTRVEDLVLISCLITQQDKQVASLSCLIAPPFAETMLDTLKLSLGWLFYAFIQSQCEQGERASKLLSLTGDVLAQSNAQTAVQEWVNQTKQLTNELGYKDLGVSLFKVKNHIPKWWVSANISTAVKGSPAMQKALELAALAITECQAQKNLQWWAYPLHDRGKVSAVLIIKREDETPLWTESLFVMLRANADLFEPIFRQWRKSEQNLVHHGYRSSTSLLGKILGKGYLAYKILAILVITFILIITLVPVNDVVTATLYVEGDRRFVITVPQQGYLQDAFVRPGDTVAQGQVVAKLEDKDLKIQFNELNSQLAQSDGQFRQAMAEMNAADSGLAVNKREQIESKLALIQRKLQKTDITAPIDGVIVSGDWQQKRGAPVDMGAELFQIADIKSYRVILHVPDKDMDSLQVGRLGKMKLTSLPDQTFDFTVKRLTAVAEVKDGVNGFTVEASLSQFPQQVTPGMQGVGKIEIGKTNLLGAWTKSLKDWSRLKLWSIW